MSLVAGLAGLNRHGCVALGDSSGLRAVCQQERVTRVRNAGFNSTGLPDEALDLLLRRLDRTRSDVNRYVVADRPDAAEASAAAEGLERHLAHAATTYFSSPFTSAAIVICDRSQPTVSVWTAKAVQITPVQWPWRSPGFSDVYARCAEILGFQGEAGGQRMEALARLRPDDRNSVVDGLFRWSDGALDVQRGWESTVEQLHSGIDHRCIETAGAGLAAALQARLVDLVLEFLAAVRRHTGETTLCLGGSLFYHSAINTAVKQARIFDSVFVPVDPGEAGLAVGAALSALEMPPRQTGPFLGPEYTSQEVKATLDNCKLQYDWVSGDGAIDVAVKALLDGTLVAWFDGPMEWGPRALGARCILANPFSPYVLENLNRFLKQREPWRGYALSGLSTAVPELFDGPADARFMECDYRPKDPSGFTHVLPSPSASLRVHTVGAGSPRRFTRLLEAFGTASGLPFLVNTSFNGFHEPIACSPRDAVRIFYGTGVDLLVFEQFVLRK
jgi:carbamoyltransferase